MFGWLIKNELQREVARLENLLGDCDSIRDTLEKQRDMFRQDVCKLRKELEEAKKRIHGLENTKRHADQTIERIFEFVESEMDGWGWSKSLSD